MLFPLFFHSFRVDLQHSAWRIRHTNHSQLLMEIAQTVEELVQKKKKQLKPSKTWEKPVMNFAEWIDLSFLFLILPNCTLPTSSPGSEKCQMATRKLEMVRVPLQFHVSGIFRKQSFGLDKHRGGWPCVVYTCWSFCVSNSGLSTWKKRQIWCSYVSLLSFERTTIELGENMQHTCLFSSECSLEKGLQYLNNVCIFF